MPRSDARFSSGESDCAAWLYRPDGVDRAAVLVMAHGFSATRDQRLDAYAERFCDAGVGALVFDYRGFGASQGEPRQVVDIAAQHADYRAAIAYARTLEWTDPDRVGLFGSSFSGGHVLAVGAADERIACVVAQCPFTDGLATLPKLGVLNAMRLTAAGMADQLGALAGRDPRYVAAVGPPGALAVMSTPDAEPGFRALTPADTLWENRVAARIALRVASYRPGRAAARLRCPVLFCVCDEDSLTPAEATIRHAQRSPQAEIKRYPIGHFDIYVGEPFERAVADQTEFLVRHLGVQQAEAQPPGATVS